MQDLDLLRFLDMRQTIDAHEAWHWENLIKGSVDGSDSYDGTKVTKQMMLLLQDEAQTLLPLLPLILAVVDLILQKNISH